ncbi:hypothetical protein F66182_8393 [Fusarium sp. NRRL 66182]|nr:hypothetical protein F66182_8393 [Fusarium sp. NRRL 66182]
MTMVTKEFPSLESPQLSQEREDQESLKRIKAVWDKYSHSWDDQTKSSVILNIARVRANSTNRKTPSKHRLCQVPFDFGIWVMFRCIYPEQKLPTLRVKLFELYPAIDPNSFEGPSNVGVVKKETKAGETDSLALKQNMLEEDDTFDYSDFPIKKGETTIIEMHDSFTQIRSDKGTRKERKETGIPFPNDPRAELLSDNFPFSPSQPLASRLDAKSQDTALQEVQVGCRDLSLGGSLSHKHGKTPEHMSKTEKRLDASVEAVAGSKPKLPSTRQENDRWVPNFSHETASLLSRTQDAQLQKLQSKLQEAMFMGSSRHARHELQKQLTDLELALEVDARNKQKNPFKSTGRRHPAIVTEPGSSPNLSTLSEDIPALPTSSDDQFEELKLLIGNATAEALETLSTQTFDVQTVLMKKLQGISTEMTRQHKETQKQLLDIRRELKELRDVVGSERRGKKAVDNLSARLAKLEGSTFTL